MSIADQIEALIRAEVDARIARLVDAARGGASVPAAQPKTNGTSKPKGKRPGTGKRTQAETEAIAEKIAAFVSGQKDGVKVEAIRQHAKLDKAGAELPIRRALEKGWMRKTGEKRATIYLPLAAAKTKAPKTKTK